MLTFILKRIGSGFVMLFAVTFAAYFLLHLGTGDVARAILGVNATQEQVAKLNEQLGINRPFIVQYGEWLGRLIHFDLGPAWSFPDTVTQEVSDRLHVTITIVSITTIFSAIIAAVLGIWAAVKGGWIDRVVQFLGLVGFAIPGFLVAFLLVYFLAVKNHIFNAVGWIEFTDDPAGWLKSITLPVLALSVGALAATAQQIRGSVKDALSMDYVRTLRARGLSFSRVVFKHVLRNAGGPALTMLGMQFVGMMGGAIIIEAIFAIPGLGPFATAATKASDIPAVMGLVVVTAIIVIVVNLVIDLLTAALNPKVRLS